MDLAVAAQAEASGQPTSAGRGEAPAVDVAELRAQLDLLGPELDRLNLQLGAAVVDGDEAQVGVLEARIDALTARRTGLQAEIAQWEAATGATAERERRRREAAARERERRELMAAQAQLYEGWSAKLEHQACVAELALELELLKAACPVDPAHLDALRSRLEPAGLACEAPADELAGCDDPARLRAAAGRYRDLARSAPQQPLSSAERRDPGSRAAGPEQTDDPDAPDSVREELLKLAELEKRLLKLRATFDGRAYQQGAMKELNRQLALVEARRKALRSPSNGNGAMRLEAFFPGFRTGRRSSTRT